MSRSYQLQMASIVSIGILLTTGSAGCTPSIPIGTARGHVTGPHLHGERQRSIAFAGQSRMNASRSARRQAVSGPSLTGAAILPSRDHRLRVEMPMPRNLDAVFGRKSSDECCWYFMYKSSIAQPPGVHANLAASGLVRSYPRNESGGRGHCCPHPPPTTGRTHRIRRFPLML